MKNLVIAKNTTYQLIARTTTAFFGFLITIIIAGKFGVLGFGDFTKATSFVAIFYLLVDFGINAFFLQEERADFKTFFYLRVFLSLGVFLIINFFTFLLPFNSILNSGFSDLVKIAIFIFSFTVFFQGIIISATSLFQKKQNYYPYMIGIIAGSVVNLFAILLIAFLNYSIFYVYGAYLLGGLVTSMFLLYFAKERILPFYFDINFSKKILLNSLPLGLMLIFNLIYFRIDIILLSFLRGSLDVGIYGLSYKFFDFLIAVPLFLSNAIYPALLKERDNKKKFFESVKNYFILFLIISIIIIIPFWFISPAFSLVSKGFSLSIIPFRILLISLPFFFTTSIMQWVLISLNKQKYLMYVYLFSAVLNIILNFIFIPFYSYIASSTITILSEGLVFALLGIKLLKLHKILEKE